jgi:hypothetical protein
MQAREHARPVFLAAGTSVAGFRLALASDETVYDGDDSQWLTARVTTDRPEQQFLTSNLPAGDLLVLIRDTSNAGIRPSGKLVMISVVGVQAVSRSCPLYERFDLRSVFSLAPGEYVIRVSRILRRSTADAAAVGTAVSNEIRVRIRPSEQKTEM